MESKNHQKIKLLLLMELLKKYTDEQHPMSTMDIIARLEDMGVTCERRTLAKDIALLNEYGFEIMCDHRHRYKSYYMDDRRFSVPEIKILLDAVHAAKFITQKKTDELVEKIAALSGEHRAELLRRNMVCFNTRKRSNESIYYSIDALERAIHLKRKAAFYYFDLGIDGNKVYRHDKKLYVVEPAALVLSEDNYYLVSYSDQHSGTVNYRVDRMDGVEVSEEEITGKTLALRRDIGQYTKQVTKMYGGPSEKVTLEFDRQLLGVIFDRYGEDTHIKAMDDGKCRVTIDVQISPTFWGWLFQFVNQMKIIEPKHIINEYQERLRARLD